MKAIFVRWGWGYKKKTYFLNPSLKGFIITVDSIKTPVLGVHPYHRQFTDKCKLSISNLFQEHTARRYLQASAPKIKTVPPASIAYTQINTTAVFGWTCFSFGIISLGFWVHYTYFNVQNVNVGKIKPMKF